jgi:hypothetical protein
MTERTSPTPDHQYMDLVAQVHQLQVELADEKAQHDYTKLQLRLLQTMVDDDQKKRQYLRAAYAAPKPQTSSHSLVGPVVPGYNIPKAPVKTKTKRPPPLPTVGTLAGLEWTKMCAVREQSMPQRSPIPTIGVWVPPPPKPLPY